MAKCKKCGKPARKDKEICVECCEKDNDHDGGKHVLQAMLGCFCYRCGKSWHDDF